jgi:membrane protein involved in colicin uptake
LKSSGAYYITCAGCGQNGHYQDECGSVRSRGEGLYGLKSLVPPNGIKFEYETKQATSEGKKSPGEKAKRESINNAIEKRKREKEVKKSNETRQGNWNKGGKSPVDKKGGKGGNSSNDFPRGGGGGKGSPNDFPRGGGYKGNSPDDKRGGGGHGGKGKNVVRYDDNVDSTRYSKKSRR